MKNNTLLSKVFILTVYALFFLVVIISLRAAYSGMGLEEVSLSDGKYYLLMVVVLIINIVLGISSYKRTHTFIFLIYLWLFFQFIFIVNSGSDITYTVRLFSWPVLLISLYYYARVNSIDFAIKVFFYGLLLLSSYSLYNLIQVRHLVEVGGINEIYWVLTGFPFVFCVESNKIKWLGAGLIVLVVLLSLKSTAILSIIFSFLVVWIVSQRLHKGKNTKSTIAIITGSILILLFWSDISSYLESNFNVVWADKYDVAVNEGGSGRVEIWSKLIDAMKMSSSSKILFGHGHNSVAKLIGFQAHNDFLEVLYDYGVIMFFLYLSLYLSLFKALFKMVKLNYRLSIPFAVSVVIFLSLSSFSHLMIYPGLMLNLAAFWGLCIGDYSKAKFNTLC